MLLEVPKHCLAEVIRTTSHRVGKYKSKLEIWSRTEGQVFRLFRQQMEYCIPSLAPASRRFCKFAACQVKGLAWHSSGKLREAVVDLGLASRNARVGEQRLCTTKHYMGEIMGGFIKKAHATWWMKWRGREGTTNCLFSIINHSSLSKEQKWRSRQKQVVKCRTTCTI